MTKRGIERKHDSSSGLSSTMDVQRKASKHGGPGSYGLRLNRRVFARRLQNHVITCFEERLNVDRISPTNRLKLITTTPRLTVHSEHLWLTR